MSSHGSGVQTSYRAQSWTTGSTSGLLAELTDEIKCIAHRDHHLTTAVSPPDGTALRSAYLEARSEAGGRGLANKISRRPKPGVVVSGGDTAEASHNEHFATLLIVLTCRITDTRRLFGFAQVRGHALLISFIHSAHFSPSNFNRTYSWIS